MRNVQLKRKRDLSTFRRMAVGTWPTLHDAQVHGTLDVRMDAAMDYIERYRIATGKRLTVTHLVARAVAAALHEMPDANALMRWGRIYLRQNIDMFLQVVMTDEGHGKVDLSGVTLRDVDQLTVGEICDEMQRSVQSVRERSDRKLEKARGRFRLVPLWLMGAVLRWMGFVMYTLNLRMPGTPRDPFGSVMITNIGSLGLETAYVPLVGYSRVPLVLAVGAVREVPVVEDGRLAVGKVMKVNVTFDHRFIDGFHCAVMSKTLREWLETPEEHYGAVPELALPAREEVG